MENAPNQSGQNSLEDVLRQEDATTSNAVDQAKLQQLKQNNSMASRADNLYVDQQVQPGQVVGYNIPTNQKVVIPIAPKPKFSGPSKKFVRSLLGFFMAIVALAVLIGLGYLAYKIISS